VSVKSISPNDVLEAWWDGRPPGPIVLTWGKHRGAHAEWVEVLSVGRAVRRRFDPDDDGGAQVVASGPLRSCQSLLATLTTVRPWSAGKNVPVDPSHVVTLTVKGPGVDWSGSWDLADLDTRSDLKQLDAGFEKAITKAVKKAGGTVRKASSAKKTLEGDAIETVDLTLSPKFWAVFALAGIATSGLLALAIWFLFVRKIPRYINSDGCMMRTGDHYHWARLGFRGPDAKGDVAEKGYDLIAADTTEIRIPSNVLVDPDRVMAFVALHFPPKD
jgi:hypothetical protein